MAKKKKARSKPTFGSGEAKRKYEAWKHINIPACRAKRGGKRKK